LEGDTIEVRELDVECSSVNFAKGLVGKTVHDGDDPLNGLGVDEYASAKALFNKEQRINGTFLIFSRCDGFQELEEVNQIYREFLHG